MTISSQAFNLLRQQYPKAFFKSTPYRCHGVVEDVIIRIRQKPDSIVTMTQFLRWFTDSVDEWFVGEPLSEFYLLRFEKPGAPRAKNITHRARYEKAPKWHPVEGSSEVFPDGILPQGKGAWQHFFNNRALRPALYEIITDYLLYWYTPPPGRTVIVDGGTCPPTCTWQPRGTVLSAFSITENEQLGGGRCVQKLPAHYNHPAAEAELGIIYFLNAVWPDRNVLVRSTDGDVVVALLLHCRTRPHPFRRAIVVLRGRSAGRVQVAEGVWRTQMVQEYVDINRLHAAIEEHTRPFQLRFPVECVCALMLMEGSDYTEKLRNTNVKNLWRIFFENATQYQDLVTIQDKSPTTMCVNPQLFTALALQLY